jgi:hypothetical protein
VKLTCERGGSETPIVIDDATGRQIDFDMRGSVDDVVSRLVRKAAASAGAEPRGRGRPKLGVVSREVTLLPRHWEWLEQQIGGASGTLRRLVDDARATGKGRQRQAQVVTDRFMAVFGGNLPNYEEASRALYAGEGDQFRALIVKWPQDIRFHALRLSADAFAGGPADSST